MSEEATTARVDAPVQATGSRRIPWEVHKRAADRYHELGHRQSAERLADRGGFGWMELAVLLAGGDPYARDPWKALR